MKYLQDEEFLVTETYEGFNLAKGTYKGEEIIVDLNFLTDEPIKDNYITVKLNEIE